jgi:hypothetical protein
VTIGYQQQQIAWLPAAVGLLSAQIICFVQLRGESYVVRVRWEHWPRGPGRHDAPPTQRQWNAVRHGGHITGKCGKRCLPVRLEWNHRHDAPQITYLRSETSTSRPRKRFCVILLARQYTRQPAGWATRVDDRNRSIRIELSHHPSHSIITARHHPSHGIFIARNLPSHGIFHRTASISHSNHGRHRTIQFFVKPSPSGHLRSWRRCSHRRRPILRFLIRVGSVRALTASE